MKRTYFFKTLFFAFALFLTSCGGDSSDDGGGDGDEITSITLSRQFTTTIYAGDNIFFEVRGNNNANVTSSSTIKIDGNSINGSFYETQAPGVHSFVASYNDLVSNTLQVNVLEPPTKFTKNVLLEDYTGAWCGYCPRVAYGLEQVKIATDKSVPVAIHRGNIDPNGGNHDPYNFSAGTLENIIGLSGYPTAMIDRTTEWTYPEPSNVAQVVSIANTDADLGLAITPSLNGSDLSIDVKVKFGTLSSTNAKLVVYVLEDDLIYDQVNYTSYYGGTSVISDFEHDHVLRACLTNLLGDTIPTSEVVEDNTYSRQFDVAVPSNIADTSKMSIVAFVINGSTNAAYNSRSANIGDSQSIEEL